MRMAKPTDTPTPIPTPKPTLAWVLLGRALEEGFPMAAVDAAEVCNGAEDIDDDSKDALVTLDIEVVVAGVPMVVCTVARPK